MNVSDFDFHLPDELIAQEPPPARGDSRLLVLNRGSGAIEHATFAQLATFLRRGDLLVRNNTRVFPARLLGHRVPSGGAVECLLLGEIANEPSLTSGSRLPAPAETHWDALVHPGQKLKPGARMLFERDGHTLALRYQPRYRPLRDAETRRQGKANSSLPLSPSPSLRVSALGSLDRHTRVPDLAIEVQRNGEPPQVLLLDAKYRLDAEGRGVPQDADLRM